MGAIASQITSLTIVYSIVCSEADQRKIKAPRHWPLCREFTGDRWIPRTNGQLGGKCFHLMTSSCAGISILFVITYDATWSKTIKCTWTWHVAKSGPEHTHVDSICVAKPPLIARFMEPTWVPPGANRTQVGPMWATWTLLSGSLLSWNSLVIFTFLKDHLPKGPPPKRTTSPKPQQEDHLLKRTDKLKLIFCQKRLSNNFISKIWAIC